MITVVIALALTLSALAAGSSKPDIILMYIDDMGFGDLSSYGHPTIMSPNIDRLASEGIRFTQYISAAPLCTPSRAALMTGRYPIRSGMCSNATSHRVLDGRSRGGLPANETTISEALLENGYRTKIVGKWHLGINGENQTDGIHLPTRHGFESFYGMPWSNVGVSRGLMVYENETIVEQACPSTWENLTHRYTAKAIEFLDSDPTTPRFLYLSFTHVHAPMFSNAAFQNVSLRGAFGDNVAEVDDAVGQVVAHVKKSGRDTVIFLASDNGPWRELSLSGGSAGLLRGGKAQIFEGGIRLPAIAWWPGQIPAGIISDTLVSSMDFFPTIMDITGTPLPKDRIIDGKSILALLKNPSMASPHESLIHYCGCSLNAARVSSYKAVFAVPLFDEGTTMCHKTGLCQCVPPFVEVLKTPLLYQIDIDPGENYPISEKEQEYTSMMEAINSAVTAHKLTVEPVTIQNELGEGDEYEPCCDPPKCQCCKDC